jgi:hypothetical protein
MVESSVIFEWGDGIYICVCVYEVSLLSIDCLPFVVSPVIFAMKNDSWNVTDHLMEVIGYVLLRLLHFAYWCFPSCHVATKMMRPIVCIYTTIGAVGKHLF